ncbi:MAG: SCO family protein [Thiotrichales bacterium]
MRRWVGLCLAVSLSLGAMAEAPRPARTIPDFTLTDQNGEPWSTRDRQGTVTLVSFGYTSCPDVCPLTLQVQAAALRALGDRAGDVRVLFISVDPTRDRPDRVKDYVRYFDSRIVGLTGDKTAIDRVVNHFGATYAIGAETTDGGYTVEHSANLFVVDRAGRLVTVVPFGLPPEHIARTVRNLLAESRRD